MSHEFVLYTEWLFTGTENGIGGDVSDHGKTCYCLLPLLPSAKGAEKRILTFTKSQNALTSLLTVLSFKYLSHLNG